MTESKLITQVCVVVHDVAQANANWAKVLGVPAETIVTIFPDGILHYTHDKPTEYKDCQVAKYQLGNFVLELIQPGASSSPWRTFLEEHGQGVFHVCIQVEDRKDFQQTLSAIGVGRPYHVGYFPGGSYSYVDAKDALGLELSINNRGDYRALFDGLLNGTINPLDEIK